MKRLLLVPVDFDADNIVSPWPGFLFQNPPQLALRRIWQVWIADVEEVDAILISHRDDFLRSLRIFLVKDLDRAYGIKLISK